MSDPSELISDYLDGALDATQAQTLRAWLKADPANADRFARESFLHGYMRDLFAGDRVRGLTAKQAGLSAGVHGVPSELGLIDVAASSSSAGGVEEPPQATSKSQLIRSKPGWRRHGVRAVAALLLLAVGLIVVVAWTQRQRASDDVATVVEATAAEWVGDGAPAPISGASLSRCTLALRAGSVRLRFGGGAEVTVVAPASMELQSGGAMRLSAGKLTAHVGPEAVGFTVHTPTSTIVDLGTEFGLLVEPSGATEAHVIQGAVELTATRSGSQQRLSAATAVRVDAGGSVVSSIAARPQDFAAAGSVAVTLPAQTETFLLPDDWKGRDADALANNPIIVAGQPRWRFERVWPPDPMPSANYQPLVWRRDRWVAAEHVHDWQPGLFIDADRGLVFGVRGPWGPGGGVNEGLGGKWPALVFVAPRTGHYLLTGRAEFKQWQGDPYTARLIILKRDKSAARLMPLADVAVGREENLTELSLNNVMLNEGQELVLVVQIEASNTSGEVRLKDLRIVAAP